jgi:predicted transcriptional regulator
MEVAESTNKIRIRITDERWAHVVESHDYMAGNRDLVLETIEDPDSIVTGRKGELIALRHYQATSITEKHVVVVYREFENDGFLITAFMTSTPETILRKGVIWQKPPTS